LRLRDIAALLGGEIVGDPELEIKGVSGMEDAQEGEITFAASKKTAVLASRGRASCIIVKETIPDTDKAQLKVDDPHYAFARLLEHFYQKPRGPAGISGLAFVAEGASLAEEVSIHACAYVSEGASVGRGTVIYPGAFIGDKARVGQDCVIHPNVVVREGVSIGDRVIIHAGSVIGSDGFGYVQRGGIHHKVPQVGTVTVGDDVEIGANVTIDRATTGATVIGKGTKIDNLVQVAHNVKVGENAIVVAQAGIAGSSVIGSSVVLAGQVGISDHVKIEDGTVIGAQSGVMSDLSKGFYSGSPAMSHREWLKAVSLFARLPELNKRIQALEGRLKDIERRQGDVKH
jgi:UDP-3-O-[3-hydroxymyristoyl] glucosamine N-acyltransferase